MRNPSPRRVLGYARVSSLAQTQGTSLADQQASITAYAKARGLKVTTFFVESESGILEKFEKREQIQQLMATVREGDLVICDKLDRWSRDPAFSHTSIGKILAMGADFYAVSDGMDPSTHDGDSMLNLRVLVAREESKRIRERMVGTRWRLRDAGYWVEGMVPYGYKRSKPKGTRGPEKNVLVVDDEAVEGIRKVYAGAIRGLGLRAIAAETGIGRDTVARILKRRFYTGQMQNSRGEWIVGLHPPIVSIATFEKASEKMRGRALGGPRPRDAVSRTDGWIVRDVATCGVCGRRMTAAYGSTRDYYLCIARQKERTCKAPHVRRDLAEPLFMELVAHRLCTMVKELSTEPKDQAKKRAPVDYAEKSERLARKRARIVEAFTDGAMTRDEMRAAIEKVDLEVARIAEASTPQARPTKQMRREALAQVVSIRKAWGAVTDKQRRAIVNELANKALLKAKETPVAEWKTINEVLGIAA